MINGEMKSVRRSAAVLLTFGVCVIGMVASVAQRGAAPPPLPGRQAGGETLLPNGWKIAPAGHHIQIGDLPLNMAPSISARGFPISIAIRA